MATNSPPRFVPTLTETANTVTPRTTIEDVSYFEKKDPVDSMLDLDLSDLEAPVSRIEQVSPLGAYQGNRVHNPQAVNHAPVGHPAPQQQPSAYTTRAPAAPAVQPQVQQQVPQPMLPADWQNQLQALVQQTVRHELQQQMPFLLLQWSKQIEDKLTPHVYQQLTKLIQGWQSPAK